MFPTDHNLIASLKADNKRALTALYDQYWKPLYLSSFNVLRDKETCEEIIQDVFIDIWNKRDRLEIQSSLKGYLFACVRYKVFAEIKKNNNLRVELFENIDARLQHSTPETEIIHKELRKQIRLVVDNLPDKCRVVYKMSRNEHLSHKEISERLNISTKTVENHITNALRALRASLDVSYILLLYISLQIYPL